MNDKIAIIGSGALGTSLAKVLVDSGNKNVVIYGVDEGELKDLSQGMNTKFFPKTVKLPNFNTTLDLEEVLKDAKYIVIAVPSFVMDKVFPSIVKGASAGSLVVCGSKGFFPGTKVSLHEKMSELSADSKNIRGVVSLIGPSHAEEIVLETPTIITAVDTNIKLCTEVQELFSNAYFRIYTQTDVKGAEVGAAYKNVLAIASGVVGGLGYGINSVAALLTRGMAEMARFNEAMGGKPETIMGLTGLGDLIVTATSDLSRNYTFGKNLAKLGKEKALDSKITVEGLSALKVIYEIGQDKKLRLPIVDFLFNTIYGDKKISDFLGDF